MRGAGAAARRLRPPLSHCPGRVAACAVGIAPAALLLGAALGACWATQFARRRAAAIGRTVDELEQRHEIALGQLRTQKMRAQAELEQTCNNLKRQLKASAGKSSAQLARVEECMRAACAEFDGLRAQLEGLDTAMHGESTDGFAATEPMPVSKF